MEALFIVVLDTFDPHNRDTAKAKFPASARWASEAGLQAQVMAGEKELSEEIGGLEAAVFLAPMGVHNAIGFEARQEGRRSEPREVRSESRSRRLRAPGEGGVPGLT